MKRPIAVTIIGLVFIAAGALGLAYHLSELKAFPLPKDAALVLLLRVLAIVGGVFMLRGQNWARWLTVLWLASHVVLSIWHSMQQTIAHAVMLAIMAFFLFRPDANAYFRGSQIESGE